MPDGTLVAAASGLRNDHVCPFGRSVFFTSADQGRTWSNPRVVNDSPLDDRDTGIVSCGGRRLLLTWFTTDNRPELERRSADLGEQRRRLWEQGLLRAGTPDAGGWGRGLVPDQRGRRRHLVLRDPGAADRPPRAGPCSPPGELLFFGKLFEVTWPGSPPVSAPSRP